VQYRLKYFLETRLSEDWKFLLKQKFRQDLIKKGRFQCQKFSWENMTKQMLSVYKEIG
jgi:glycosyltransferase involved in cell wall biosynthesis